MLLGVFVVTEKRSSGLSSAHALVPGLKAEVVREDSYDPVFADPVGPETPGETGA